MPRIRVLSRGIGRANIGVNTGLSVVEPTLVHRRRKRPSVKSLKKKTAMVRGFFDELEKISQAPPASPAPINTAPAPGMGAQSPGAMGPPGAGSLGGSAAPPPPPDPASTISAGKASGLSAVGSGA